MIELFGIGIMVGLIALVIWLSKGSGYKDAIIEKDNVEKEIIEENRKATWANLDSINKLDVPERAELRKKWSRKP